MDACVLLKKKRFFLITFTNLSRSAFAANTCRSRFRSIITLQYEAAIQNGGKKKEKRS